jgi:hypothetical protein
MHHIVVILTPTENYSLQVPFKSPPTYLHWFDIRCVVLFIVNFQNISQTYE